MKRIIAAFLVVIASAWADPPVRVPVTFPPISNFYSPSIIDSAAGGGGAYDMWVTEGDRVVHFASTDGIAWAGGQTVLSALKATWEDDGGTFDGYTTGISDPRVVTNATPGWLYTMYYTAGTAPNTPVSGGIGVAVSHDGFNWQRMNTGAAPLRSFPGGFTFVSQALFIRGVLYLFYLGGGDATSRRPPSLYAAKNARDGLEFDSDAVLQQLPPNAYPLFFDEAADSCWMAVNSAQSAPSGPCGFDIYQGSDCFSFIGTRVATVGPGCTHNVTAFGAQALQRTGRGARRSGSSGASSPVELVFAAGDSWGGWMPMAVRVAVSDSLRRNLIE